MSERVVVVTGAASGIGFATAERFRDLGDTVFGLDIAPTVPDGVTYVECNVGSKDAVDAAIATCAASGRIDVLANVAGVVQFGRFEGVTEEVFDRTLDIDLKGPFFLMQAALPHLRAAGGNIVNVSSVAGRIPQPYSAAYSAAKGGLTQLTKALALELSPEGIRVNAVCPRRRHHSRRDRLLDRLPRLGRGADDHRLGRRLRRGHGLRSCSRD